MLVRLFLIIDDGESLLVSVVLLEVVIATSTEAATATSSVAATVSAILVSIDRRLTLSSRLFSTLNWCVGVMMIMMMTVMVAMMMMMMITSFGNCIA